MSTEFKTEVKNTGSGVSAAVKFKDADAEAIVRRNSLWALGVGLLPLPGLDLLGVTAIQIKMLNELARNYKVEFSENRAKSILSSLAGGLGTLAGAPVLFSLVKVIPILGQTAGLVSMPLSAGAFTYAVGKIFTQHFASGGTFLSFDPESVRDHFRSEFESAKQTVKDMQKESGAPHS
ncbi:YcjF family protein [Hyalangium versicolor]|uniref:YcjF family protein n=1 Tax=Hyalangium versicolor TaxID=2861190 RepID=UPI001CCDE4F3|nr:DUF697 domain-containing protein [Hyalangium versicolor]